MTTTEEFDEKADRLLAAARKLAETVTTWADFSNDLFAQDGGLVAEAFPDLASRRLFCDTRQYGAINEILLGLMKRFGLADGATPAKSGKFLVRVPKSLHSSLSGEATREGVSLNQLVTAKLSVPLRELLTGNQKVTQ